MRGQGFSCCDPSGQMSEERAIGATLRVAKQLPLSLFLRWALWRRAGGWAVFTSFRARHLAPAPSLMLLAVVRAAEDDFECESPLRPSGESSLSAHARRGMPLLAPRRDTLIVARVGAGAVGGRRFWGASA